MVIGYHRIIKYCALNIPQNLIYTTGLATHWIPFILINSVQLKPETVILIGQPRIIIYLALNISKSNSYKLFGYSLDSYHLRKSCNLAGDLEPTINIDAKQYILYGTESKLKITISDNGPDLHGMDWARPRQHRGGKSWSRIQARGAKIHDAAPWL